MSDRVAALDKAELHALARVAMRDYPGDRGDRAPAWVGDLAILPFSNFHAHDRIMHAGLITWDNGWRLTEAGRSALDAATPRERA